MAEGPAAEVGSDGRGVGVKELVHPMQRSVFRLAVDWRDVQVLEALDKLVDGGGNHGGELTNYTTTDNHKIERRCCLIYGRSHYKYTG